MNQTPSPAALRASIRFQAPPPPFDEDDDALTDLVHPPKITGIKIGRAHV